MKKSLVYLALLLITGLCMAACGNNSVHELTSPSPTVVPGSAVSESQKVITVIMVAVRQHLSK